VVNKYLYVHRLSRTAAACLIWGVVVGMVRRYGVKSASCIFTVFPGYADCMRRRGYARCPRVRRHDYAIII
jgi:hypothetical protein